MSVFWEYLNEMSFYFLPVGVPVEETLSPMLLKLMEKILFEAVIPEFFLGIFITIVDLRCRFH